MSAADDLADELARRHETHEWLRCQQGDPERFHEGKPDELLAVARECAPCPIRALCGAVGDERQEVYGIWGGQIRDRQALRLIKQRSKKAS